MPGGHTWIETGGANESSGCLVLVPRVQDTQSSSSSYPGDGGSVARPRAARTFLYLKQPEVGGVPSSRALGHLDSRFLWGRNALQMKTDALGDFSFLNVENKNKERHNLGDIHDQ